MENGLTVADLRRATELMRGPGPRAPVVISQAMYDRLIRDAALEQARGIARAYGFDGVVPQRLIPVT